MTSVRGDRRLGLVDGSGILGAMGSRLDWTRKLCSVAVLVAAVTGGGCSAGGSNTESALLVASDLGDGFDEIDTRPASPPCSLSIVEPANQSERSFASVDQVLRQRVLSYDDANAAGEAFTAASADSSCDASEFGVAGGAPTAIDVDDADEAFSIDFADSLNSSGVTVARHQATIVVIETTVHQGAADNDPVAVHELMDRVMSGLE